MIKLFTSSMLGLAATGAALCCTATRTLTLALGPLLLTVGSGGLSAVWMSRVLNKASSAQPG